MASQPCHEGSQSTHSWLSDGRGRRRGRSGLHSQQLWVRLETVDPMVCSADGGTHTHFALVCFLEPLAQSDEAALLEGSQVTQVSLDVVSI